MRERMHMHLRAIAKHSCWLSNPQQDSASCCICLQFKAGATCGDTDGDGSAGPTFSTCSASLNKLYDSAQAAVAISGLTDEAVRALCCKVCGS